MQFEKVFFPLPRALINQERATTIKCSNKGQWGSDKQKKEMRFLYSSEFGNSDAFPQLSHKSEGTILFDVRKRTAKNNICWTNYRFVSFRQLTLICTAKKAFYFEEGGGTKNPMIDAGFHTGPFFSLPPSPPATAERVQWSMRGIFFVPLAF